MRRRIKSLLKKGDINEIDIARALFPDNLYPVASLNNVLDGTRQLKEKEIDALFALEKADVVGTFLGSLDKNGNLVILFSKGYSISLEKEGTFINFPSGDQELVPSKGRTLREVVDIALNIIHNKNQKTKK